MCSITLLAPRSRLKWGLCVGTTALLIFELWQPSLSLLDRLIARTQFPVLSNFETPLEERRWSAGTRDASVAIDGNHSLRVTLHHGRRFSGATLRRSLGDWSDYHALQLSIYLPDDTPMKITVSIRDREHFRRGGAYHDRFNRNLTLQKGWNTLELTIEEIRNAPRDRNLDLSDLTELAIFTSSLDQTRTIYLDSVRLLR